MFFGEGVWGELGDEFGGEGGVVGELGVVEELVGGVVGVGGEVMVERGLGN